ncbi:Mitochondrial distribution and morphology protein 12, partial [Vermiconidia calcicola]
MWFCPSLNTSVLRCPRTLQMSVDINWETLTGGADGHALAETIRAFVHERFQQISFPKLIRSVKVHAFEFGEIAPDIVLKDICEPLPDFYETSEQDEDEDQNAQHESPHTAVASGRPTKRKDDARRPSELELLHRATTPGLNRGAILGGGPGFGYFHPAFSAGLSGTTTPLAAVAGAQFQNGPPATGSYRHHQSESFGSVSPPSATTSPSRPLSRERSYFDSRNASAILDGSGGHTPRTEQASYERNPEDMQVVFHVTYSGDVRLSMTAEVVLDYPMPSFVGIPLKLKITGMTFNGVGILAHINKRAHLCFLSPEDAEALVGSEGAYVSREGDAGSAKDHQPAKVGGLLEEIRIESEMGENEDGKQVLKNVGKIEKFILEQVQHIFEEEFVYPSFWTFL